MHRYLTPTIAAAALIALTTPVFAQDDAIKARQGLMRVFAHSLGQLGAMAKGEMEFNAENAQVAADNLLAAASIDQRAMWPQGSDNAAMSGKTRALPVIWTDYPDIETKAKALKDAAAAMQAAAGSLEGIQANMGAVGGACGACHKAYRQSDN